MDIIIMDGIIMDSITVLCVVLLCTDGISMAAIIVGLYLHLCVGCVGARFGQGSTP